MNVDHVRNLCFSKRAISFLTFTILSAAVYRNADAAEFVAMRKITEIGCHNYNGTCFVTLDGPGFGSSMGCPLGYLNSVRWDNASDSDPAGVRTYAALNSAFIAQKNIGVFIDGCSAQGYFKLSWYVVASY